jgi:hypothetical protein
MPRFLALATVAIFACASTSCIDPVHDEEVTALGGEVSGVEPGPLHRPGQPCLACHGGRGPAERELSFAGTVYLYRDQELPAEGTEILIREIANSSNRITLRSNAAGNFYVAKDGFDSGFPVSVAVVDQRIPDFPPGRDMVTPIGRNGGCAFCHVTRPTDTTRQMPRVYVNSTATPVRP